MRSNWQYLDRLRLASAYSTRGFNLHTNAAGGTDGADSSITIRWTCTYSRWWFKLLSHSDAMQIKMPSFQNFQLCSFTRIRCSQTLRDALASLPASRRKTTSNIKVSKCISCRQSIDERFNDWLRACASACVHNTHFSVAKVAFALMRLIW